MSVKPSALANRRASLSPINGRSAALAVFAAASLEPSGPRLRAMATFLRSHAPVATLCAAAARHEYQAFLCCQPLGLLQTHRGSLLALGGWLGGRHRCFSEAARAGRAARSRAMPR
eukprot:scaffold99909_cov69-Phaeocystis_antarctica.AAC.5